MSERDEKNRKLAEWLGWFQPTSDETSEALKDRRSYLRHWTLHRHSNAPIENFSSYYWTPADFYTDEAANALLLEKMDFVCLRKVLPPESVSAVWECYSEPSANDDDSPIGIPVTQNADRKTAIAECALKLIDVGGAK